MDILSNIIQNYIIYLFHNSGKQYRTIIYPSIMKKNFKNYYKNYYNNNIKIDYNIKPYY